MASEMLDLSRLPQLAVLFSELNNGKHITRVAQPELWAELEREAQTYTMLFQSLGYELRIDGRGIAWFHTEEANSNISQTSRQLALLFMAIFDTQADAGLALLRFGDWHINRALMQSVFEQHKDLLVDENLDVDGLLALVERASRYGFARPQPDGWQLLPAVCRYLDHYEALEAEYRSQDDEFMDEDIEEGNSQT